MAAVSTLSARLGRNKLKGVTAMLNMFGGGGGATSREDEAEMEEDRDRLRDFQVKMMELQVSLEAFGKR